jgi:hypothetical protein
MANICNNELHAYSEDPANKMTIESFFTNKFPGSEILKSEDTIEVFFESKWVFPEKEMNELYESLPNKSDIDISCLSTEWGDYYTAFHVCNEDGWSLI